MTHNQSFRLDWILKLALDQGILFIATEEEIDMTVF